LTLLVLIDVKSTLLLPVDKLLPAIGYGTARVLPYHWTTGEAPYAGGGRSLFQRARACGLIGHHTQSLTYLPLRTTCKTRQRSALYMQTTF
jgi:hypothetical protein